MKTQPVVGEHRIGLGRLRRVVHCADADAFAAQRLGETFELRARPLTRLRGTAQVLRTLEGVGGGRLRVVAERVRPHHEYGIRTLWGALGTARHGSFSHVPKRCGSQARLREGAAPAGASDSDAQYAEVVPAAGGFQPVERRQALGEIERLPGEVLRALL